MRFQAVALAVGMFASVALVDSKSTTPTLKIQMDEAEGGKTDPKHKDQPLMKCSFSVEGFCEDLPFANSPSWGTYDSDNQNCTITDAKKSIEKDTSLKVSTCGKEDSYYLTLRPHEDGSLEVDAFGGETDPSRSTTFKDTKIGRKHELLTKGEKEEKEKKEKKAETQTSATTSTSAKTGFSTASPPSRAPIPGNLASQSTPLSPNYTPGSKSGSAAKRRWH